MKTRPLSLKIPTTAELPDDLPAYLFSTRATSLLTQIARGEINAQELASDELANRGLDVDGRWVGFKEARRLADERRMQMGAL